jgi:hypothetical protein
VTAGALRQAPPSVLRLVRLHAASRRLPAAVAMLAACAAGLRGALFGHWDAYGALQLPLIFEAGCAAVVCAAGLIAITVRGARDSGG